MFSFEEKRRSMSLGQVALLETMLSFRTEVSMCGHKIRTSADSVV
jgi:hypothetical protein